MDINGLRQRVAAMAELSRGLIAEHDEHFWFDFSEYGSSPEEVEPTLDAARNLLSRLQALVDEVPRVQDDVERAREDAKRQYEAAEALYMEFDDLDDDAQAIDNGATERDTLESTIEDLEQRIADLRAGGEKGLALWQLPRKEKRPMARKKIETKGWVQDVDHLLVQYLRDGNATMTQRLIDDLEQVLQAARSNLEEIERASGKSAKGDVIYGRFGGSGDDSEGYGETASERDVGRFMADSVVEDDGSSIRDDTLFAAFEDWCRSEGLQPLDESAFASAVRDLGIISQRIAGATRWIGISRKSAKGGKRNGIERKSFHDIVSTLGTVVSSLAVGMMAYEAIFRENPFDALARLKEAIEDRIEQWRGGGDDDKLIDAERALDLIDEAEEAARREGIDEDGKSRRPTTAHKLYA